MLGAAYCVAGRRRSARARVRAQVRESGPLGGAGGGGGGGLVGALLGALREGAAGVRLAFAPAVRGRLALALAHEAVAA